jgi:hypothetical protein
LQTIRVVAALAGGLVVVATSGSVLKTLVMPGGRVGWMMKLGDRVTDRTLWLICRPLKRYEQRYPVLAYEAPLILALLLGIWLFAYLIGFGLLLWPTTGGLAAAIRESGSSLLTLGFASTRSGQPTAVDFVAGATGLVVVALQIAYLPTLYAAFNRRETEVTLLGVRAGRPAWGPELLARTKFTIVEMDLPDFYREWERWAADVAESHSSYPILLRFRSPNPEGSWLVSLLAVMDSAALYSALAPATVPIQARLCLAMGFRCLQQLATSLGIPFDPDPRPDSGTALSREEFDAGIARLESVGFEMERTPDEAWPHFQGWRVNYESIAYRLAWAIDAVPAAWSGPRRSGEESITPRRVINRTPENPEGTSPPFRPQAPAGS